VFFTSKRQIQECLINITETIAFAEKNKIPGFVLALDMAKAFDTVRHDFVDEVYKFFGFGPWLTNALNTISTGRTACVILGGGRTSAPFDLRSGFPQGNPPSPDQFNLCQQIFLFKLELDPRIKRLKIPDLLPGPVMLPIPAPAPGLVPVPVPGHRPNYGGKENNGETGKVESFADDATVMAKLEESAFLAIKKFMKILAN
jgi:hypothetical protein